jgi:hypothetical protein
MNDKDFRLDKTRAKRICWYCRETIEKDELCWMAILSNSWISIHRKHLREETIW